MFMKKPRDTGKVAEAAALISMAQQHKPPGILRRKIGGVEPQALPALHIAILHMLLPAPCLTFLILFFKFVSWMVYLYMG